MRLFSSSSRGRTREDHWRARLWFTKSLHMLGRNKEAAEHFDPLMQIALGNPARESWTRCTIGIVLTREGRFDEALDQARRGLALARQAGDDSAVSVCHDAIVTALSNSGRYRESLPISEQRLVGERLRRAPPLELADALNDIGVDHRHLGRFEEAIRVYQEALALYRQIQNPEGTAKVLYNLANMVEVNALRDLGRIETAQGRFDVARQVLQQAIALADAKSLRGQRAMTRAAAARNEAAAGRGGEAIRFAEEALQIAEQLDDPEVEFEVLEARAIALEAAGRATAVAAYLTAIDLLESWRGRLALGDLRIGVAERRLGVYEGAIRLMLQQGRVEESFEIAERARARVLLALMAEQDVRAGRTAAAQLRQRLREAYEARRSVRKSLHPSIDRDISGLTAQLAALEAQARLASPAMSRLQNPLPAGYEEIHDGLLRNGAGLIAFFWGDRDVYAWWLGSDDARGACLGAAASLASIVEFLRTALESPSTATDWRPPAELAFNEFIAPIAPTMVVERGPLARRAAGGPPAREPRAFRRTSRPRPAAVSKQLLVIPDGPLALVPLETFIDPRTKRPLGSQAEFIYGPSASVLLALRRREPARTYPRAVLAVGDPNARSVMAGFLSRRRSEDVPLPYAREEVRAISRLFRADGSDVLIGARATLDRWESKYPGRYRFLHFATTHE